MDYKRIKQTNESREYRVNGVDKSAAECMFTNKDNVQQSVAEYFSQTYGPLKFPKMFTLKVGPVKRSINLPIEVCDLDVKFDVLIENFILRYVSALFSGEKSKSYEKVDGKSNVNNDPSKLLNVLYNFCDVFLNYIFL